MLYSFPPVGEAKAPPPEFQVENWLVVTKPSDEVGRTQFVNITEMGVKLSDSSRNDKKTKKSEKKKKKSRPTV